MKKRVVFFGFSVTRYGSPPYPVRVSQILAEQGCNDFDIQFAALGGVSLECVPYITDQLKKFQPDLLVFEIGTSHYSTEKKDIAYTKYILLQIINNVSTFCHHIDFLLLPRSDIPGSCTIPAALKELASIYPIGVLDLRHVFDAEWATYAIDNVHPSEAGIERISSLIKDNLLNRTSLAIEKQEFNKICNELMLKKVVSHYQYPLLRLFEHSNFSCAAVPLRMDETLEFRVDKGLVLRGIFYVMGPDTSSLELMLNGEKITVRTFDKFSYYYRIGYTPFYRGLNVNKNDLIKLKSSNNRLNTVLEKDSLLKFDGIMNYPISFACDHE